jgi:hypothetical protein
MPDELKTPIHGRPQRYALLQETLNELLAGRMKFKPACSPATYTTNVNHSMLVADCEKEDSQEAKAMGAALQAKGQASADIICQLNSECPHARLLKAEITRNDCKGRQWDVDVRWTFECVP